MTRTIIIDPVTRIEGHLKIKVELSNNNKVEDIIISGNLFRDFENILKGRHPWDAVHITQRICGVCPVSHALTATKAAEQAAGFIPNNQALFIRAIIQAAYFISDHILHFYHLNLMDYITPPPVNPLTPNYNNDMRFSKNQTEALFNNYIEGLKVRRQGQEMVAVLAGRIPHVMSIVPGGITQSPTEAQIQQLKEYYPILKDFVLNKYLPDAYLLAETYQDYFKIGQGVENLICYESFELPNGSAIFKPGNFTDNTKNNFDLDEIEEFVKYAYYSSPSGLSPKEGETIPSFGKPDAYTWLKAPRHKKKAYETGPLARMMINGYYSGKISVMDRILARAEETKMLVELLPEWINQLTANANTYTDLILPNAGVGIGLTEAPRGALGHWLQYSNHKIDRYQIITPTCWNASPKDDNDKRGAMEEAILDSIVENPAEPVELLRIIHSFDPCISCSVHVIEAGKNLSEEFIVDISK